VSADRTAYLNRRAAGLFLLYLCVVVYLSLYPIHPGSSPIASRLAWDPISSRYDLIDTILNLAFYMPLGAAAFVALRDGGVAALAGVTALCGLISLTLEWAQLSIPSRDGNLRDLAANGLGAFLGAAMVFAASTPPVARRLKSLPPATPLFGAMWLAWHVLALLRRSWTGIDIVHELLAMLILVMVLGRKVSRLAAPLLLVWLAVEELRPFQFQSPAGPFSWIPFEGWFRGSPESYFGIIAAKLFLYTAVIWVMRRSGARMLWAFLAPAAILAAGEFAQRYLPGRTPEITDLVLLAAGVILLRGTAADG
jgi:VanZ family protein